MLKVPKSPDLSDITRNLALSDKRCYTENMQEEIQHFISFEQGMALSLGLFEEYENVERREYVFGETPSSIIENITPLRCTAQDFGLMLKVWPDDLITDANMFMPLESFCLTELSEINFSRDVYRIGLLVSRIFGYVFKMPKKFSFPRKAIERRQYIKSIQKVIKIIAGVRIPNAFFTKTIGAVVLGAKDSQYQVDNKLNKEKIEFFTILYHMTGPEEKRPRLNAIIKKIRLIRYKMILRYRKKIAAKKRRVLENEYHAVFDAVLSKRESLANDEKHMLLVNSLDAYLFKMMDSIPTNRPKLEDVKDYYHALEVELSLRYKGTCRINHNHERASSAPNNTSLNQCPPPTKRGMQKKIPSTSAKMPTFLGEQR